MDKFFNDLVPTMTSTECKITSSGTYYGDTSEYKAFDKDDSMNSAWISTNNDKDPWICVKFTTPKQLNAIKTYVFWGNDYNYDGNFTLKASNNGANLVDIITFNGVAHSSKITGVPNNQKYKYYKLSTNDNNYNQNNGICEYTVFQTLQFYGR